MYFGFITREMKLMAMTPEKRVKNQIVKQLKTLGEDVYYFFPATGGYGRSGVPDIVGCYKGKFFAIECKAGKNTTTALQERELANIAKAAGVGWVVNEDNIDSVREVLLSF
jgi:Holliday junction resolvase